LVHISALSSKYVADPREVVKTGQLVKVKVMEVEVQRGRIGLSMRLDDEPNMGSKGGTAARNPERRVEKKAPQAETAFAAAFAKLKGN
jgi:uncharacterized protein